MAAFFISWFIACALGVFGCWLLRSKAAGFTLGFALVGFYWLLVYVYSDPWALTPCVIP